MSDEIKKNEEQSQLTLVRNMFQMMRSHFSSRLGQSFGGQRDIYNSLGYKKDILFQDYWDMFRRARLGRRIVKAPVESTWRGDIALSEGSKAEDTEFELGWKTLNRELGIISKLARLDTLVGLGEFAILLLGFDDGGALDTALVPGGGERQLIYLQPYHQGNVDIVEWDDDVKSPRYGLPIMYQVGINKTGKLSATTSRSLTKVHFTRVIHVAEGLLDNEVFGTPRLESVYNGVSDLDKIAGGNAEMYWQGALGGKAFSARDGATLDTISAKAIEKEIDEYLNGMRRYLKLENMDVQDLSPGIVDPNSSIQIQLELISGDTRIPKRILVGSERGELASTQDESNWLSYIKDRREQFAEPCMLRPLVNRLMEMGALPEVEEYQVEWPDLWALNDQERADLAVKWTQALSTYSNSAGLDQIIPPEFFLEHVIGLSVEELDRIKKLLEGYVEEPLAPTDEAQQEQQRQEELQAKMAGKIPLKQETPPKTNEATYQETYNSVMKEFYLGNLLNEDGSTVDDHFFAVEIAHETAMEKVSNSK